MTLKQRLDAVWNSRTVACPMHIAWWSEEKTGYNLFGEYKLWFRKGKMLRIRK